MVGVSNSFFFLFCPLLPPPFVPDHPTLEPKHFVDEKVVNENHHDYMFLECIKFINEVRGTFRQKEKQKMGVPQGSVSMPPQFSAYTQ